MTNILDKIKNYDKTELNDINLDNWKYIISNFNLDNWKFRNLKFAN